MGDDGESLAVLPRSMGNVKPGSEKQRVDPKKFIPKERGGLLLSNPKEEESPYTFSDSPAYVAKKQFEEAAKRAAALEEKDETRGFLRHVEELGKKHKWEEALQVLERRTAVPSGLFLVTRAVLRWKFGKYGAAFRDIDDALNSYGSSAKAGPLAGALSCFARVCMGSRVRDKGACSTEMKELISAWEEAELRVLNHHALGQGLFHPRPEQRLSQPGQVVEGMEAHDGSYVASTGLRIGFVFLKNQKECSAPLVIHFHGSSETAADYRRPSMAEKYRDLPVHLLVVDYRGYGWSSGEPSLATFLSDAEPLAEKLPEVAVQHGLAWPYPSGLILSGRSLGAQVAVHLAALFPSLFRGLFLDSAMAISATGDRLGRAPERAAALKRWRQELGKASLEVLEPLDSDFWCLSALEKIKAYDGQLLLTHGLADETVPYEGSESLHAAAGTRRKEIVLIDGAGHNTIGHFEAYWTAQRRFSLKVQLDDSLPKIGAAVKHLCCVCGEKAGLKCGRCQQVWYCGRKCQAEHWKEHKMTCAGCPPEPKPRVEPEAEACLVAALIADIQSDLGVASLRNSLASLGGQEVPLHSVRVSWCASSDALAAQVRPLFDDFRLRHSMLPLVAIEAKGPVGSFEHVKSLADAALQEATPSAWVALLDIRSIWSRRFVSVVLPALRRAAADSRVVAVSCLRHASAKDATQLPEDPDQVEAGLASGTISLGEEASTEEPEHLRFSDMVVRIKVLRTFCEVTPSCVLSHSLCAHHFRQRLLSTFGKKVQTLVAPRGEWLRWVAPAGPLFGDAEGGARELSDVDRTRGRELFEGLRLLDGTAGVGGEGDATTNGDGKAPLPGSRIDSPAAAASAVARVRREIERKVVQFSGETISARELRALGMEQMNAFLEETGLSSIVGIQRWAKQTSLHACESAARQFEVEVATGQK